MYCWISIPDSANIAPEAPTKVGNIKANLLTVVSMDFYKANNMTLTAVVQSLTSASVSWSPTRNSCFERIFSTLSSASKTFRQAVSYSL